MAQRDTFLAIGALFEHVQHIDTAAQALGDYLIDSSEANRLSLVASGVNPVYVHDFLPLLPTSASERRQICALARAWALGRSSAKGDSTWHPVITAGDVDPQGIDRLTAETMIGLIVGARRTARIFSPFLDARGLGVLGVAIAAATRRDVRVSIGYVVGRNRGDAIDGLIREVERAGDTDRLVTVGISDERAFPHLKVIAVDGTTAYIGSANLTWSALTSNAEIGALVTGKSVGILEIWFDAILSGATPVEAVD